MQLYATTGAGFDRSNDGGHHWRCISAGLDRRYVTLCIASPRSEQLYTAAAASPPPGWVRGANAALYRSDDGGEHWVRLERGLPAQFNVMVRSLAVDTEGVYAAAGHELFASSDRGESWQLVAGDLPTVRALIVV